MKNLFLIYSLFSIKLLKAQEFEWVVSNQGTEFEGITNITTDAAGNIYTTGNFQGTTDFDPADATTFNLTSAGGTDIFIQKLNADGELIWAKSFGSPAVETVSGIAVDAAGNCFITGWFLGTVDFDPSGATLNLTSEGIYDAFVQKLDADGNLEWARSFGGTDQDKGKGITVDADGNCYTIGSFIGSADLDPSDVTGSFVVSTNECVFVQKLDSDGLFVYGRQLIPTASASATPMEIAVDASNNPIIIGQFNQTVDFNPAPGFDYDVTALGLENGFIVKLSDEGWFDWMVPYLSVSGSYPVSVKTDADGNIYTSGLYKGTVDFDPSAGTENLTSAGDFDIFIQKLDANGNNIWVNTYGGVGFEFILDNEIDSDGNILTTGYYSGTVDFDPSGDVFNLTTSSLFLHKSDSDGNFIWATDIGAQKVAAGNDGDIYIGGSFEGTYDFDPGAGDASLTALGSQDACIIKFGEACLLDNSVTQTGITLTSNQAGVVYQWVDCNDGNAPILGENNQNFTPTMNGNYAVEVTFDGCTEISACTAIGDVGLTQQIINTHLYPNPTNGLLNIVVNAPIQTVILFNLNGEQLELFTTSEIDLSPFPSGIYLLQINTENGTAHQKISKF